MNERTSDGAGRLYDYAVSKPEGFTYQDVERDLDWDRGLFFSNVRRVRLILADDEISLTCDPQGQRDPWIYRLVGNYDDARAWATNRVGDLESRLETVHAVSSTCVSATDGRSIEGRKARKVKKTVGRLIEDLAEIYES